MSIKQDCLCGICQAPADKKDYGFQCRKVPGHIADLVVGIWSDEKVPDSRKSVRSSKKR